MNALHGEYIQMKGGYPAWKPPLLNYFHKNRMKKRYYS